MIRKVIILAILLAVTGLFAQISVDIRDSYNAETIGDYSRALEVMKKLAASDASDAFYQLRLGWLYYLLQDYDAGFTHYQRSHSNAANLDAQIGMLNCQLALGKWNDAITTANTILNQYSQNTAVMTKAAYAAFMKQDYRGAADYYQRVIRINQWDMEILGYLVANLYLSGQTAEAKKYYQKLKKYNPASTIITEYGKFLD